MKVAKSNATMHLYDAVTPRIQPILHTHRKTAATLSYFFYLRIEPVAMVMGVYSMILVLIDTQPHFYDAVIIEPWSKCNVRHLRQWSISQRWQLCECMSTKEEHSLLN